MNGESDFFAALANHMRQFTIERNWTAVHTPKNLAMAIAGEAGELVAEFQWLTPDESRPGQLSEEQRAAIEAEMADVLIYLVQLADSLGTDLPKAVEKKMAVNAVRFPPIDHRGTANR